MTADPATGPRLLGGALVATQSEEEAVHVPLGLLSTIRHASGVGCETARPSGVSFHPLSSEEPC